MTSAIVESDRGVFEPALHLLRVLLRQNALACDVSHGDAASGHAEGVVSSCPSCTDRRTRRGRAVRRGDGASKYTYAEVTANAAIGGFAPGSRAELGALSGPRRDLLVRARTGPTRRAQGRDLPRGSDSIQLDARVCRSRIARLLSGSHFASSMTSAIVEAVMAFSSQRVICSKSFCARI